MNATSTSWLRRNRWGLAALPVALALALAASSDRVRTYYWLAGLHDAQSATDGPWLPFRASYLDAAGTHPLDVDLRLDAMTTLPAGSSGSTGATIPSGARLVEVTLSLRADPELPLTGCTLAVRDAEGTRYQAPSGYASDDELPTFSCVPDDTPGPGPRLGAVDAQLSASDTPPRPAEWTVTGLVLVPEGVAPVDALVWWQQPSYAQLTTS